MRLIALGLLLAVAVRAEVPRISAQGMQLPGGQFYSDAGFDLLDWNGDGKLDLFLFEPSMTSDDVYLNQGSRTQPKFGFGFPRFFCDAVVVGDELVEIVEIEIAQGRNVHVRLVADAA